MTPFTLTLVCTSRDHCPTCRDREGGRAWRRSLSRFYSLPGGDVDFACPAGVPWGAAVAPAATRSTLLPGDVLARVIHALGFAERAGCDCGNFQGKMNRWGWWGCWRRRAEIVAWLCAKAKAAGVDVDAATVAGLLRAAWRRRGGQSGE